jgi:PKD repeat protein
LSYETNQINVNNAAEFDLTGVLPSGMYLIKYLDQNGGWQLIGNVVLIPEDIDDSQDVFGFTLEIHYLEQSFDNTVDMSDYVSHMKNAFNAVIQTWFDYQVIQIGDLVDSDGTVPLYVKFPSGEERITYYHDDRDYSAAFGSPPGQSESMFFFRSKYNEIINNYSYQDIYQVLNILTAHETFHWVSSSLSTNLWNSSYSGRLKWLEEGLSVMAQAIAYNDLELTTNSIFTHYANHFLSNLPTGLDESLFDVDDNFSQSDEYAMGLFFYYMYSKCGDDWPTVISSIINHIDSYLNPGNINDKDAYETGVQGLLDYAIYSSYENSDAFLGDFSTIFLKKEFLSNILDYQSDVFLTGSNVQNPYNNYDIYDLQVHYSDLSLYKKEITANGNMEVECSIELEQGNYGNYYVAVSLWDENDNPVPNSFNDVFLSDENHEASFNLQVHEGNQVMISKMNLSAPADNFSPFGIINFIMDEELICDFSSNTQDINEGGYVQFQNLSVGNIDSYNWSFDGGHSDESDQANPEVVYNHTGSYDVSLTVVNENDDTETETKEDYINVVEEGTLIANFQADNTMINVGDEVHFTDLSTGDIQSYQWNFDGGTPPTSNVKDPAPVTYYNSGSYDVSLTVSDATESDTKVKTDYITVIDQYSSDVNCYAWQDPFDLTKWDFEIYYVGYYYATDEFEYHIDYGDQYSDTETTSLSSVEFTHTYANYGTYNPQAAVMIYDENDILVSSDGCSCPQINLSNPTCEGFTADFSITPNPAPLDPQTNDVTVEFLNQSTGGTHPYSWHWSFFGDDYSNNEPEGGIAVETYNEAWGDNGNPDNKTYTAEGVYPVTLVVTDNSFPACIKSETKYVQVFEPEACIDNLSINYGGDLFYGDRLFVPWQEDGDACNIPLRYRYFFNSIEECNKCYERKQHYEWFVNGNLFYEETFEDYYISSGAGVNSLFHEIEIHSQDDLNPGMNTVSVSLEGHNYDHQSYSNVHYSCSDYASIEVITINCDAFMNTGAFLALNSFINIPFFTSDDIYLDDYGYLSNDNNWLEFYSGDILLNEDANNVINNNDVKLTACNGVVLEDGFETGNASFVAQGGVEIESCNNISSKLISQDTSSKKASSISQAALDVFPNPVGERFRVKINHPQEGRALIQLFDTQGRLIKTIMDANKAAGCYAFEVRNFNVKPGMYFCKYITNEISLSEKIVKTQYNYE